jgi:hypothetical protein
LVGVNAESDTNYLVMLNAESGSPVEAQRVRLDQQTVFLKAECNFRERTDKAQFFYSLDGKSWVAIGASLKMTYTLPHFMGYRFALFNYATKTPGGFADFDFFRVSHQLSGTNEPATLQDAANKSKL